MKMKSLVKIEALLLLVYISSAVAHQDGLRQTNFKPESNDSWLRIDVQQGVSHMSNYWSKLWHSTQSDAEQMITLAPPMETTEVKKVDGHEAMHMVKEVDGHVPAGRKQMYFRPVSVTLQCVMVLTIVSVLIYTLLSISRNTDELSATFTPSQSTQMLTMASRGSSFAPMLCMLFVGCRMYVLATTEGLGEPPAWVKSCMWTAVSGVLIQLIIVMALPMYTKKQAEADAAYDMTEGKKKAWDAAHADIDDTQPPSDWQIIEDIEGGAVLGVTDATGEQNDVHPDLNRLELKKDSMHLQTPFWLLQIFSMFCIYGGITGVIVGILTFPAGTTKISAAVLCTIALSALYFGVTFVLWIARSIAEEDSPLTSAALCMTTTTRKAPMFAVLFLASRMRALQLDPPYGIPPYWMQCCFYGITAFVYLESLVALYVGGTGDKAKGYYGVYLFRCGSKFAHLCHHGCALVTYGLLIPVVHGVYQMKDATGVPAALSTTMECVLYFEAAYFGVVLVQDLTMFVEEFEEIELTMLRDTAISAGISLGLAPLLCILFVATRMRALQITQQLGDPPGWAQDCMVVAVFATCTQALCCLLMPIFIGSACKVDEDGNPDYDLNPMVGAYAVAMVKYVALMFLHGSVIAVCYSVFSMTPETANSSGRFLTSAKALTEMFAGVLVVFCIALLFSSAKVIGMAIKMVIEAADQELIGVDITIKKVALNLFKGFVHVSRLVVHQPEFEVTWTRQKDGKLVGTPSERKCVWKEDYIAKVDLVLIKVNLWRILSTMGKEFELENLSVKGIHFNVEKPDTNMKAENANIQYIINHLDALGLIPPPDKPETLDEKKKKVDERYEELAKVDAEAKAKAEAEAKTEVEAIAEDKKPVDGDAPLVIIHKIALGDIGAGVCIRNVKFFGEISFHPSIGLVEFDDVQQQIFGGKEDLKPAEMVACIIQAIARHVFDGVMVELPHQIAKAASDAAQHSVDAMKTSVDKVLKKIPCNG